MGGARGLVKNGGLLVIASPFAWNTRFTPKEVWLGGVVEDGKPKWSVDELKETLREDFEHLETTEVPFLIRESKRRYTLIETVVTVWKRK
jgi:hypothetical protein